MATILGTRFINYLVWIISILFLLDNLGFNISGVIASLDRAHFYAYGDFSLNYKVVYFVNSSDYNYYIDVQQQIDLKLKQEFYRRSIQFAYPTQMNLYS